MADNEKDIHVDVEQDDEETTGEQQSAGIDEEALETPLERFFYHQRRALEETGQALEALLPPDFRRHSGQASREFTQGFRVLVDAAIDELKKVSEREEEEEENESSSSTQETGNDDDDDPPSTTGKNKVKIKLDDE